MKIKLSGLWLLVIITLMMIPSCRMGKESGLPRSTGSINEILIVTKDKDQWDGPLGDTLTAFFSNDLVGISQPEPMFDLLNIPQDYLNDVYKKYHNILIIDINPDSIKVISETNTDIWSHPQRVIKVTAPDAVSFYHEFDAKKETYLDYFNKLERERTVYINEMGNDLNLMNKVETALQVNLTLPGGFNIAKEAKDFIWLRHSMHKIKQDIELGILIYCTEYKDTAQFRPNFIMLWRNIITQENIPGPSPESYMKIANEFIPPVFKKISDFPVGFAIETRGLWDVENDFMGGSFISYTFVDQKRNRIVTLDGYVYNPNNEKRNYIRQLESIFYTLKLD